MLYDVLEKYHLFPGLTLLLGSIFQYVSPKQPSGLLLGIVALSYVIQKWGEEHTLDDIELYRAKRIFHHISGIYSLPGTPEFFSYLMELLESPERSGTHIFDQQRYAMAAKECLQLYLCSHRKFSKGATQSTLHNQILCWSKPLAWLARLGIHSRIWKARHHFKVQEHNFIKTCTISLYVENTQMTCHVGMPSCGQCHCNMFIDLLLTCTITNTIINDSLTSPPCASSPAPFSFAHPPIPVLSVNLRLKPNPVEEDRWKGFIRPVHRPSPRAPTHPIDYRVNTSTFYLWWREHPQDVRSEHCEAGSKYKVRSQTLIAAIDYWSNVAQLARKLGTVNWVRWYWFLVAGVI